MSAPSIETVLLRLDEIRTRQEVHDRSLYGDRENPADNPGIFMEMSALKTAQKETNTLLTELRDSVRWIVRVAVSGVVVAVASGVVAIVFKGIAIAH